MGEKESSGVRKTYVARDIGAGARVQQGEHNVMQDVFQGQQGGEELAARFDALLERIEASTELSSDEKELTRDKAARVAESLARAEESPDTLRRSILDAKAWLQSTASWAWDELTDIFKSDVAKETIGKIAGGAVKAGILALF